MNSDSPPTLPNESYPASYGSSGALWGALQRHTYIAASLHTRNCDQTAGCEPRHSHR
ncbi:hypothetical protein BGZ63DRAFT_391974 [Mariannaea sp. PMI_226]|nr:hypothetical protein BGZ63DRAFT_391974 [Mariannaea sp. PMI_226]